MTERRPEVPLPTPSKPWPLTDGLPSFARIEWLQPLVGMPLAYGADNKAWAFTVDRPK